MPPAFALSQDQTLRFISNPAWHPKLPPKKQPKHQTKPSTNRTRTRGLQSSNLAKPKPNPERPTQVKAKAKQPNSILKRTFNASKRYINSTSKEANQTSPDTKSKPIQLTPNLSIPESMNTKDAANVSLPSLCNCQ